MQSVLFVGGGGEATEALARELKAAGYRVSFCPAGDVEDALTTNEPPDVLVVDLANAGELGVRIRRALEQRRPAQSDKVLRCGDLTIDLANYKVFVADQPVGLTYKEYELLRFLATNPDTVFTRDTLLNKVWGYDFYGGARTVDVHIRRLRSKIEDQRHCFIETVRNVGYRFRSTPS